MALNSGDAPLTPVPADRCADGSCPVARAVQVLGGKWALLVIRDLLAGTRRFGELRDALEGVSPKTLTDRLRELEAAGLVRRTMYNEIPPRVEYELTDLGRASLPVIEALAALGRELPAPTVPRRAFMERKPTATT